jgi:hypothetical protein
VKRNLTESGERLKTLKRDIALNQYEVDAGAVADAILNKLRLVKRGRLALAGETDRTRRAGELHRRSH